MSRSPARMMTSQLLLTVSWWQRQQMFWRKWLLVALLTVLLMFALLLQAQLARAPTSWRPPLDDEVVAMMAPPEASAGSEDLQAGSQLIASPARLYWHERHVTDWYLRVQLTLGFSPRSLPTPPSLPLQPSTEVSAPRTFQPLLSPRERARLRYALELFSAACRLADLTYFLLDSSLVGSLRHHGVVPWHDVSVVVAMPFKQQELALLVLESVQGATLFWPNPYSWSFRLKDVRPDPPDLVRMTYIDIRFYRENVTHLWGLTWGDHHTFLTPRQRVFPLRTRPFEDLQVPVPCDPGAVLHDDALSLCHMMLEDPEKALRHEAGTVPCDTLQRVFPFVTRHVPLTSSTALEELRVNGSLLYSIELETGCTQ